MWEEERPRRRISGWFTIDILMLLSVFFGFMYHAMYPYYPAAVLIAAVLLLLVILLRQQYDLNIRRSRSCKIKTALLRILLYVAVLLTVSLPMTLRCGWKWYYPVQKAIYGTDAQTDAFLPEEIPKTAQEYSAFFFRGAFPDATRIILHFYADDATIDAYRQKAIDCGAATSSDAVNPNRWAGELEEYGVSFENAEFYFYPGCSERFPRVYILDEATGFVMIYY